MNFLWVSYAWIASVLLLSSSSASAPNQLPVGQPEPASDINSTPTKGVSLNIWTKNGTRNETAPYLSGLLFEDIAHSGDGGIYAELLRNRAFQGSGVTTGSGQPLLPGVVITESENPIIPFGPTLDGWSPIGEGVQLHLDLLHPLSSALQVALRFDVPLNCTGEVGFKNDGWWGIPVSPQTYNASFHVQTNGFRWNATLTHLNVSLRDDITDEVFVSSTIQLTNGDNAPVPWMYRNYSTQLYSDVKASTTNNKFAITMDAEEARGQTLYFSLLSLFPETYKNRPNGLRKDLAETLEAGAFRFLRFPGGNNLEGYSVQRRWKWWETIGPLINRPGRPGDWSYYNTDGLGLMEYMYWCEDMDLVPVLGVFAGFSLDIANYDQGNSTDANELPISMMGPVLQEALDELEFLTADTSTYWGAKRAEYGHPEPFHVPFVEIGNEDFFSHNYAPRAAFMRKGLKAQYPDITYVYSATTHEPESIVDSNLNLPRGVIWDSHVYAPARFFINHFDQFDNWQVRTKNQGAFASIMEYHVNGIDSGVVGNPTSNFTVSDKRPAILSGVAEAVYHLGWERNPNVVKLACFAPLIQNQHVWRHTPYLLLFDADPDSTIISTSFYQEKMFNLHHGTHSLPVTTADGEFNPMFWQASIDVDRNKIYLKIVNAGNSSQKLNLQLDTAYSSVNGTTMHANDPEDLDAVDDESDDKTAIVPQPIAGLDGFVTEQDDSGLFWWEVPPWSVNVFQFNLNEDDALASRDQHEQGSWRTPRLTTEKWTGHEPYYSDGEQIVL